MLKKRYIRPLFGSQEPEVEKFDPRSLSETALSNRLDSFARINSDLDKLEADEKIINGKIIDCDAKSQEINLLDDAFDKLATEPSHWVALLTVDVEPTEPSFSYRPVNHVTPTLTERGSNSPIIIQSGGVFKQNTFFGNEWDGDSVRLLCKRIMIDSFLFSLAFSFLLLVLKSATKSIIITVRENREIDDVSSYQRLRGGDSFIQRAFDQFLKEMEMQIDGFLNNPAGALFLKRLVMVAIFGSSSGYIVWLVYCLSIRFGLTSQAEFDQSMRSLKNFSAAWASFIISAGIIAFVGTVFGLLILSAWSMYIDISAFEHSRKNALLERERIERQRLLRVEKESVKLMERLSKLDKSKLEKYMKLLSERKVLEDRESVEQEQISDDAEGQLLSASDKLRLKIRSIDEASRKLLFYTCPNLYQSEYTGANLGSPLEKTVFNFLSGEDIDTIINYINTISEPELREDLGELAENPSSDSLSEQSLCLVAIRIGLIKEFMPEFYTGLDTDIQKFLNDILIKGFERCAFHAEDAKPELFDYGGQENVASDKPKFKLFHFDLPPNYKGYKVLRGGSTSDTLPYPPRSDVRSFWKERLVRDFGKRGYAGPNALLDLDGRENSESKKNIPSTLWQGLLNDRTLLRAISASAERYRKANYGSEHSVKVKGSRHAFPVFAYMPELLADEFNRQQKRSGYRTPPVLSQHSIEIARRNVMADLKATLERCDYEPDDPSVMDLIKASNELILSAPVRKYNEGLSKTEGERENITVEIFKRLGEFAQNLLETASDEQTLSSGLRKNGGRIDDEDSRAKMVAEMVQSVTVQVTGASSSEDVYNEVKRVLRRIVESSEGVHNYEQIKYMVAIFMLRRYVKVNSSPGQRVRSMVSRKSYEAAVSSCSALGLILAIPENLLKKSPEDWRIYLKRKLSGTTVSEVTRSFDEVKRWMDDIPSRMRSVYKEFGGILWDEKEMNIVLLKLAGFDKRPLTKDQEIYAKAGKQIVDALIVNQQVLQRDSLSWQLANGEVSLPQFEQAAKIGAFSLSAVERMGKGHELTPESREMSERVEGMARVLNLASKRHSSIAEFPTQTEEETVSGSLTGKTQLEQLSMYLLHELSDVLTIHRAFRIDEEDGRVHGFFGHYDKPDIHGMYSTPTQNSLWALLSIVYNPYYGQFEEMKNSPFNIDLKKAFPGNVATFGFDIANRKYGSAAPPELYVMFDSGDDNELSVRPLINAHQNGGIISQETQLTRGPKAKEIKQGQIFDTAALSESRKSAAVCLTQPTNLSLRETLEHWISYISIIADGYETAGRGDGSFYGQKSVKDILMRYCDDYNNAASYDNYIKELIEKGEMSLGGKNRGVCVYNKGIFQPLDKQFVPLIDRVKLSNPEKGPRGERIYGSSWDEGSVNPAKVNGLKFDPTFGLEIFRLLTHLPLVMLSTNLQGKIVGDHVICLEILACFYRQKSEELKRFRGSEEKFAEIYPYYKHKDGLAGFIHESLNKEIIPLINASQSGSDKVVNENFILRCFESNVISSINESDESEDAGTTLYKHATKGVRSSVLRSVCRTLPEYIRTVDDLELFLAMVQVEWGSGRHLGKDHVTLEGNRLVSMNDVDGKVKVFIERVRNACITKNKERLIRENLVSSLQDLMDDIHKTHPLRSLKLFHEFSVQRLVAFGHFLHISDNKQKNKMRKRLKQSM